MYSPQSLELNLGTEASASGRFGAEKTKKKKKMAGGFAVVMHLNVYFNLTDYTAEQFCICTDESDAFGCISHKLQACPAFIIRL